MVAFCGCFVFCVFVGCRVCFFGVSDLFVYRFNYNDECEGDGEAPFDMSTCGGGGGNVGKCGGCAATAVACICDGGGPAGGRGILVVGDLCGPCEACSFGD